MQSRSRPEDSPISRSRSKRPVSEEPPELDMRTERLAATDVLATSNVPKPHTAADLESLRKRAFWVASPQPPLKSWRKAAPSSPYRLAG